MLSTAIGGSMNITSASAQHACVCLSFRQTGRLADVVRCVSVLRHLSFCAMISTLESSMACTDVFVHLPIDLNMISGSI